MEKCLDSEYIVKEEPTVFAGGSDKLCVRKKPKETSFYGGLFLILTVKNVF